VARGSRALARGTGLLALAVAFLGDGCSLLLDWNAYTGGAVDAAIEDAMFEDSGPGPVSEASAPDATTGVDAGDAGMAADAGEGVDAGDGAPPPDAKPPCATSCGGCCDPGGTCLGGRSAATCGAKGASCVDCTMGGDECDAGVCAPAPPPKEGGTVAPTCSQTACMAQNPCVPVWQQTCCKADQTCGCQVLIPPSPLCR